jgi:hypothetical protein
MTGEDGEVMNGMHFRGHYIPEWQMGGPDLLGEMEYSAVFDGPDNEHRLELRRVWDRAKPLLVVCMTNPSRASHLVNDPTVLALIWFGTQWGYGGLLIVNGATWRSASPDEMRAAPEPESGLNWWHLQYAVNYAHANGGRALVAWGNDGADLEGCREFARRALNFGVELVCLGTTNDGHPKHPMARGKHRIPRDQPPIIWQAQELARAALSPKSEKKDNA